MVSVVDSSPVGERDSERSPENEVDKERLSEISFVNDSERVCETSFEREKLMDMEADRLAVISSVSDILSLKEPERSSNDSDALALSDVEIDVSGEVVRDTSGVKDCVGDFVSLISWDIVILSDALVEREGLAVAVMDDDSDADVDAVRSFVQLDVSESDRSLVKDVVSENDNSLVTLCDRDSDGSCDRLLDSDGVAKDRLRDMELSPVTVCDFCSVLDSESDTDSELLSDRDIERCSDNDGVGARVSVSVNDGEVDSVLVGSLVTDDDSVMDTESLRERLSDNSSDSETESDGVAVSDVICQRRRHGQPESATRLWTGPRNTRDSDEGDRVEARRRGQKDSVTDSEHAESE